MCLTFETYVALEKQLNSSNTEPDVNDRHESYCPSVLIALKGIVSFNSHQFLQYYSSFMSSFSNLLRCEDFDVRSTLAEIHDSHISPLILSLVNK